MVPLVPSRIKTIWNFSVASRLRCRQKRKHAFPLCSEAWWRYDIVQHHQLSMTPYSWSSTIPGILYPISYIRYPISYILYPLLSILELRIKIPYILYPISYILSFAPDHHLYPISYILFFAPYQKSVSYILYPLLYNCLSDDSDVAVLAELS